MRLLAFVRDVVHKYFYFAIKLLYYKLGGFNKTKVISPLFFFFFDSVTVNLCLAFFQLVLQDVDHFPMLCLLIKNTLN